MQISSSLQSVSGARQRPSRRARAFAVIVSLAVTLAACVSTPGPKQVTVVPSKPGVPERTVYVATTRQPAAAPDVFIPGTSERLHYFAVSVAVPPVHRAARIERPVGTPDPARSFAITSQQPLDQRGFLASAASEAQGNFGIFVHGYNVGYEESVFRVTQMVNDANLDMAPMLFAWPSLGERAGYIADKDAANASRDQFAALLTELATDRKRGEIVILAHSMGGWLTMETLRQLRLQGRGDVLDRLTVILASPDIDTDVFWRQVQVVGPMKTPLTVLVSRDDRILALSDKIAANRPRAGTLDVTDPAVAEAARRADIRIIDLTALPSEDSGGHSKYVTLAALYPQIERAQRNNLANAGAFVFDAIGATISSPFTIAGEVLGAN